MPFSIVILAAGYGSRMKASKPKIMQELCKKPMIFYILEKLSEICSDIHLVLGYKIEEIRPLINKNFPQVIIHEQDLKNYPGTAGALFNVKCSFENCMILCADMPLVENKSLLKLANFKADLTLCVFTEKRKNQYGRVFKDEKGIKIIEYKDANTAQKQNTLCNAGVYFLKTKLLEEYLPKIDKNNKAKEYYLTELIPFIQKADLFTVDKDEFMGVNDKRDLAKAEEILQDKIKNKWMQKGVIFHLPKSTFISLETVFKGECELYENLRFEGKNYIKNSIIKSSCVIEDSVIEDSVIGPLAHIRPNCEIKASFIGNFTECKNAKLKGVKANHLSYLGDCDIGEGTNIGCGSITCNYDGEKKHKSIVGKGVFIGSNTNLIAPVCIGDEAVIAAGSCVIRDVPKNALYINRAKEYIKKDYKK